MNARDTASPCAPVRSVVGIAMDSDPDNGGGCLHVACDDGSVFWWKDARPASESQALDGSTCHTAARPAAWVAHPPVPGTAAASRMVP